MTTRSATITWPDILNYLADHGYFTSLSPIENKLHDALLLKLNRLFFPEFLEISNTELIGLTGLKLKAIIQARASLVQKQCYCNWVWRYKSNEYKRKSGHYFFNYDPIKSLVSIKQVYSMKQTSQEQAQEGIIEIPQLTPIYGANDSADIIDTPVCEKLINMPQNGNDHNKRNIIKFNENNNDNINKDNDVNVVLNNNVDENFVELLHKEIETKLMNEGMNKHNFNKLTQSYNWDQIVETYNVVSGHSVTKAIDNYVGYFVNTLKNISSENVPT